MLSTKSQFSDAQPITGSVLSTNSLYLGEPSSRPAATGTDIVQPDRNALQNLYITVYIDEGFDALTSLNFQVLSNGTDSNWGSADVIAQTSYDLAALGDPKKLLAATLPINISKPYLRMKYEVTGTAPTKGKVSSYLSFEGLKAEFNVDGV